MHNCSSSRSTLNKFMPLLFVCARVLPECGLNSEAVCCCQKRAKHDMRVQSMTCVCRTNELIKEHDAKGTTPPSSSCLPRRFKSNH